MIRVRHLHARDPKSQVLPKTCLLPRHMSPPSLRKPNIPPRSGSFWGFYCKAPTSTCSSGEYIQGNCWMCVMGRKRNWKCWLCILTHLATLAFRSNSSFTSLLPQPVPTLAALSVPTVAATVSLCSLEELKAQGLGGYPSFLHPVHDSKENTISDSKTSWRFLLRPQIFSQSPP